MKKYSILLTVITIASFASYASAAVEQSLVSLTGRMLQQAKKTDSNTKLAIAAMLDLLTYEKQIGTLTADNVVQYKRLSNLFKKTYSVSWDQVDFSGLPIYQKIKLQIEAHKKDCESDKTIIEMRLKNVVNNTLEQFNTASIAKKQLETSVNDVSQALKKLDDTHSVFDQSLHNYEIDFSPAHKNTLHQAAAEYTKAHDELKAIAQATFNIVIDLENRQLMGLNEFYKKLQEEGTEADIGRTSPTIITSVPSEEQAQEKDKEAKTSTESLPEKEKPISKETPKPSKKQPSEAELKELMDAITSGNLKKVHELAIDRSINVNVRTTKKIFYQEVAPIIEALWRCENPDSTAIVETLILAGAYLNGESGETPTLHQALWTILGRPCSWEHNKANLETLIKHGANPYVEYRNQTALEHALVLYQRTIKAGPVYRYTGITKIITDYSEAKAEFEKRKNQLAEAIILLKPFAKKDSEFSALKEFNQQNV